MADETVITPTIESAAPSTPAPVETAPVTTSAPQEVIAPENAEPQFTSDQDRREYLRSKLGWKAEHPDKPVKTKPSDAATPPEIKPAEEVKTDAEKKPDEKPAETKAEEVAADPLDKIGPLPAEKIAAALKADPEGEAKLASLGLSGAKLIETAREAAQATQFKELFPTLEIAQVAKQGSENFAVLDEKFPAIKDEAGYNDFMMNTLVPMSYIRDADGKPIPDPGMPGAFKTDGSVARFIKMSNDVEFGQIKHIAGLLSQREDGKEFSQDLLAAVDFIQDFRNNGYQIPGAKPAPGTEKPALPPEVQAELDRHRAAERERHTSDQAAEQTKFETFENGVTDTTFEQMSPLIKGVLDQTSLTNFEKETVTERVWKDIAETLSKNQGFKSTADQMMSRREFSGAIKQRRVAHNLNSMKAIYLTAVDKYLAQAGTSRVEKNKDLLNKIDTQKKAAQMEPKTGAVAASSPASMTGDQLWEKAKELARTENHGDEPSNAQIIKAKLGLSQSA